MIDHFNGATFEENGYVRRAAYRGEGDVTNKVTMKHQITLADLIAYVKDEARVPFDQVRVNWATVSWEDAATPEEIEAWQEREAKKAERTEAWERATLAKLTEKYGTPALEGEDQ